MMLHASPRPVLVAVSVVTATVAALMVAISSPASASHEVTPARVAGEDRYETAAEVARLEFPQGANTAVLATGEAFPDALAGAGLTGAANAPLLLVTRDSIPVATASALAGLGVENIYILGGETAVAQDVEDELRERYDVARLAGDTRFGTAASIAAEIGRLEDQLGTIAGLRTAFVASGEVFPDALAVGSLATTQSDAFPILLVGEDRYPGETERIIADLGIEQVIIVGGTEAVSSHVETHLQEDTLAVLRLAGPDREATAVDLADFAMREFDYNGALTVVARSDGFADALAAGLHAGRNDAPILLTPPGQLAEPTHDWLHDVCPTIDAVRAVGGTDAIHRSTLADAVSHAEHCHAAEGQIGETYIVEPTTPVDTSPGSSVDLNVRERHDERPVQAPLDVTLFPCSTVNRATGTFTDADGDGHADGIATSDQGNARIASAPESTSLDPGYAHNVNLLHGALSWTVTSDTQDCTVTVVFDDIDGDNQLPVDSEGHPLEHYGARQITWS